jgi:hypothetical protein
MAAPAPTGMKGDGGDDTYVVDNVGDVVIENFAAEGTDTVRSSIAYTLGYFLDNLVLTGSRGDQRHRQ